MKKGQWHKENKSRVFKLTDGLCKHCEVHCKRMEEGSVHHTTYRPVNGVSVYSLSLKELFELKIIEWVCKKCHRNIHETTSIDGITKIRELCFMCNKRYGHKTRAALIHIDKPMCKICFKKVKKIRKMRDEGQGTLF